MNIMSGLTLKKCKSIANALALHLFYIKPWMCSNLILTDVVICNVNIMGNTHINRYWKKDIGSLTNAAELFLL